MIINEDEQSNSDGRDSNEEDDGNGSDHDQDQEQEDSMNDLNSGPLIDSDVLANAEQDDQIEVVDDATNSEPIGVSTEDLDDDGLDPIVPLSRDPINMQKAITKPKVLTAEEEREAFRNQVVSSSDEDEDQEEESMTLPVNLNADTTKISENEPNTKFRPSQRHTQTLSDIPEGSEKSTRAQQAANPKTYRELRQQQIEEIQSRNEVDGTNSRSQDVNQSQSEQRVSGVKRRREELADDEPGPSSKKHRVNLLLSMEQKMLSELREVRRELNALRTPSEVIIPDDNDDDSYRIVHDRGGTSHLFGRL